MKNELGTQLDSLINGLASYNSILNNQVGEMLKQFKEITEIQKKQQEHLEAVTKWIQEHVEAMEARKKIPVKK